MGKILMYVWDEDNSSIYIQANTTTTVQSKKPGLKEEEDAQPDGYHGR